MVIMCLLKFMIVEKPFESGQSNWYTREKDKETKNNDKKAFKLKQARKKKTKQEKFWEAKGKKLE